MFKRSALTLLATVLALSGSSAAFAGSQAANVAASATLASACTVSGTPLAFGTVGAETLNSGSATSTLSVTCSLNTAYTVALNNGLNGTTPTNRYMGGFFKVYYTVYRDAGFSQEWGSTTGTDTMAGTGTGIVQTLTLYGKPNVGQNNPPAGNYTDTLTATVSY